MTINTIFEDDHLLAIDKPPGLIVDVSDTVKSETLADILQRDFNIQLERGGIIHRLDKDTSGILLVAKTQQALENLQAQFKERKIKKEYLALVHGQIMESGKVEGSIGRNPEKREKFMVVGQGKEAITEYEPIKQLTIDNEQLTKIFDGFNKIQMRKLKTMNYELYTLVICRPQTGRTHQIRVHLKHINHPIVSDETYGGRKIVRLDKRWCPRQFLHAKKIGFYHPASGEWMEVEAPLPKDLKIVLDLLNEKIKE